MENQVDVHEHVHFAALILGSLALVTAIASIATLSFTAKSEAPVPIATQPAKTAVISTPTEPITSLTIAPPPFSTSVTITPR